MVRRRVPGEDPARQAADALADRLAELELRLRSTERPEGTQLVDRALRTLAARASAERRSLPDLAGVRLGADTLELLLSSSDEPLAPFTAVDGDNARWSCSVLAPDLLSLEASAQVCAPYPALVTLGHDGTGAQILVDLEAYGVLLLPADDSQSLPVLRALAVELAAAPWRDDLAVTLVGMGTELAVLQGGWGRIQQAADTDEAVDRLHDWARTAAEALAASGVTSLREARADGIAADAWTPQVALCAGPLSPEATQRADDLLYCAPRACTALVALAGPDALSGALPIPGIDGGTIQLGSFTVDLMPQHLSDADYDDLLRLFGIAEQPALPAPGPWATLLDQPTPEPTPEAEPEPDAEPEPVVQIGDPRLIWSPVAEPEPLTEPTLTLSLPSFRPTPAITAVPREEPTRAADPVPAAAHTEPVDLDQPESTGPRILLLGPPRIVNTAIDLDAASQGRLTELAAWICLHPGADRSALAQAVWPGGAPLPHRSAQLSALRRWLGPDAEGHPYLPVDAFAGHSFTPGVSDDWSDFRRRAERGLAGGPEAEQYLAAALALVRAQPLTETPPRRYAWAEYLRQEMTSRISDVAHRLAELRLDAGDPAGALAAVDRGLAVSPYSENLYRLAFQAARRQDGSAEVEKYAARLDTALEGLHADMEEETSLLLRSLLDRTGRPTLRSA